MLRRAPRSEIRKILGKQGNRKVHAPAECLALLASCLEQSRVEPRDINVAAATLKKWHSPHPDGESVEVGPLLAAMIAIGVHPERWELSQDLCAKLTDLWDDVVGNHKIEKFNPRGDLTLHFQDASSDRWRKIRKDADRFLAEGRSRHRQQSSSPLMLSHVNADLKPLWEEILDLVTDGALFPNQPIEMAPLRLRLEERVKRTVSMREVLRALESLEKRGDILRIGHEVFQVKELTADEWQQVMEFRKYLEPLNIKFLLQEDRESYLQVLQTAKAWLDEMRRAMESNSVAEFFFANIKFHHALAGSNIFRHTLMRAALPFTRRAGTRLGRPETMKKIFSGLQLIFDALTPYQDEQFDRAKLPELAASVGELMRSHLQHAFELFQCG